MENLHIIQTYNENLYHLIRVRYIMNTNNFKHQLDEINPERLIKFLQQKPSEKVFLYEVESHFNRDFFLEFFTESLKYKE